MSTNFKYSITRHIRPYVKYFPQLTKPVLRVLIQVSVHYIESRKCSPEILDLALTKLTHAGHEIPENFCELFAAILQIMQIFLRMQSVKDQELRECLKELKFTDECAEDLSKVLHNHRSSLAKNFVDAKLSRPTTKNLQWRINISLNDSVTSVQPTIILHFQLPDGKYRTLELPLSMFHKLRYNVSILLAEMQALENRAVMKKF